VPIFSFFHLQRYRKRYRELSPLALSPHLAMVAISQGQPERPVMRRQLPDFAHAPIPPIVDVNSFDHPLLTD
jgi:hypothetical protein